MLLNFIALQNTSFQKPIFRHHRHRLGELKQHRLLLFLLLSSQHLLHPIKGAGDVADPVVRPGIVVKRIPALGQLSGITLHLKNRRQFGEKIFLLQVVFVRSPFPHEQVVVQSGQFPHRGKGQRDKGDREEGVHGAAVGKEDDNLPQ